MALLPERLRNVSRLRLPKLGDFIPLLRRLGISDTVFSYVNEIAIPEDDVLTQKAGGSYETYRKMQRDDQIRSCLQQRRLALVARPLEVTPGIEGDSRAEQAADALRENLNALDWDRITDRMHYGIYYGFAVGEIEWINLNGIFQIADIRARDRGYFRWGKFDNGLYLMKPGSLTGMLMQTHFDVRAIIDQKANPYGCAFWAFSAGADHDDEPYGLGLAYSLYWLDYFKRADIRFWLRFLEKYAMPTISGKASPSKTDDAAEREKILDVLTAITNDSSVVVPEWLNLELIEAKRTGTMDYDKMREMCDRAIAKVILGQTMTSEQEGGQYKADVAKDVRDELIQADADVLAGSFNRGPAACFSAMNFGLDVAPPKIRWDMTIEEDQTLLSERDERIHRMGFDPTEEYIESAYGPGWEKRTLNGNGAGGAPSFADFLGYQDAGAAISGAQQDQLDIRTQAQLAGLQYQALVGDRVNQMLGYLEETGDLEQFKARLTEMAGENPNRQTWEKLRNQTFAARLLGMLQHQQGAEPQG